MGAGDRVLRAITEKPPRPVLNFCDTGFRNLIQFDLHIPALLDLLGIPYAGAGPAAIAIGFDKALVSAAARDLDIAVPRERYYATAAAALEDVAAIPLPAIVKPNLADGSFCVTRDAVVYSRTDAEAHLRRLDRAMPTCAIVV